MKAFARVFGVGLVLLGCSTFSDAQTAAPGKIEARDLVPANIR